MEHISPGGAHSLLKHTRVQAATLLADTRCLRVDTQVVQVMPGSLTTLTAILGVVCIAIKYT